MGMLPQQTGDLDGWLTELATSRPGRATHGIGIKDRSLKMRGHSIIIALHMSEFQAVPRKGKSHGQWPKTAAFEG
jgi:hypothetical protein